MLENDEVEIHLEGKRKYISFDPTLHAGHIFIVVTVLISTTVAWCSVQSQIAILNAQNGQRIIDNNYLTSIESDHHKELLKSLGDLQQDVIYLTQKEGYHGISHN